MSRKKFFLIFCFFWFFNNANANVNYPNVSSDQEAAKLFNKGMLNYYGYLYVQAAYDFRQAIKIDPHCSLCYWGLAIAKKQQAIELSQSIAEIGLRDLARAKELVDKDNIFQADLIEATMQSFSADSKIDLSTLQENYILALEKLKVKYQDSAEWQVEILALYLDAIAYYHMISENNHEYSSKYKAKALSLLTILLPKDRYSDHPGLLHTYIHLAEHNLTDSLALTSAKKISKFSKFGISHYAHMPVHIYWRRGMYAEAIAANLKAIEIDKAYFKNKGVGLNSYYYEFHYLHYYHFLAILGILTKDFKLTIDNAQAVKNLMDRSRIAGLKDYRDTFFSLEHLVLARFAKWEELLKLETPTQTEELGLVFINFSKALAYLHLGDKTHYKKLYSQLAKMNYNREKLKEYQTLVLTYLRASELSLETKSSENIEKLFLTAKVDKLEAKLSASNPPSWFFSYKDFINPLPNPIKGLGDF